MKKFTYCDNVLASDDKSVEVAVCCLNHFPIGLSLSLEN